MDLGFEIQKMPEKESTSSRYLKCQFSCKSDNFDFLVQICPKIDLRLQIQKTTVGIRISILQILFVPIFRQNRQLSIFRPKFCPNIWFWGLHFKNLSPDLKLAPPKFRLCQFSLKMNNFEFFGPSLGKLPNYVWYFGFDKGEGELRVLQSAGWRFKWAGWRWIELGAKFSNTLLKFCCKAITSWRFIICFRILWFHLSLMISSKCISA